MAYNQKKLPLLKDNKDNKGSKPQINPEQQRSGNQEAHASGSRPSSARPSTSQRASQMLPLLVISSAPREVKKKVQPPALVLPDLAHRTTVKTPPGPPEKEIKNGMKESTPLPMVYERQTSQTSNLALPRKRSSMVYERQTSQTSNLALPRKRSSDTILPVYPDIILPVYPDRTLPVYPELADERFRKLWDSKKPLRGRSVKEVLALMDEKEILDAIVEYLRPLQNSADSQMSSRKTSVLPPINQKFAIQESTSQFLLKDKIALYKYYGLKVRNSKQKDLVKDHLKTLLGFSFKEEIDREGISEAIGMIAFCHLSEILMVLRDFGHFVHTKRPETTFQDSQYLSEIQNRTTLILCYSKAVMGGQPEDVITLMEHIVTEILFQFSTNNKDEGLKKAFMKSVTMITQAVPDSRRQDVYLPRKEELVTNILEVIEEDPAQPLSVVILHQAIITITCMTNFKPMLSSMTQENVVGKTIRRVFELPGLSVTKVKVDSAGSSLAQDFYKNTLSACNTLLTSLVSEEPNLDSLQGILMLINSWIESPRSHERERALKSTNHVLKFASEHVDFDTTADFALLGQLVALLGIHIGESSKVIGQISAEAAFHLHRLIMSKMAKENTQKKKGVTWKVEDFSMSGPAVFYSNSFKMAKAFSEHLTTAQLQVLLIKALGGTAKQDGNMSQAAGALFQGAIAECGMDVEELPMIIREVFLHVHEIWAPAAKESILKAVCHLASQRTSKVVDALLESSMECNGSAQELWRALVADPYATRKIMKPLLQRLQNDGCTTETTGRRNSKSIMPIAATNAFCFILSLPDAVHTLQNKLPHILIGLMTQIYFLLGGNKQGSRRSSRAAQYINVLGNAVQAVKNLIMCAGYKEEYKALGTLGCWEMLLTPDHLFEAIFHLVRNLFTTKLTLKLIVRQAKTYLSRPDIREKTIGMVFLSELLYYPEVGQLFLLEDILDSLHKWIAEPYPLIQIFSIRGLGYLLQHPFENKSLEPVLMTVIDCASQPDKSLATEALRTLQFMFRHLKVETYGSKAVNLIPLLLKYFSDEDTELRYNSINIFGILLKGMKEIQNNNMTENVMRSLVPLFIQLANGRTKEVSKNTLKSCVSFLNWEDVPGNLFDYQIYSNSQIMYMNIWSAIINKCKENIPEMLEQILDILTSRNPSHQEAAARLIACCAQFLKADVVTSKEIEKIYLGLQSLEDDSEASVAQAAAESMEEVFRQCGHRINPALISSKLLKKVIRSIPRKPSRTKQ